MAKKVDSQATSYKDYMGLPINIKRGNPVPLDTTAVWYDKTAMETYATSGATAYVGQVLVLALTDTTEAYIIKDAAGTLVKLATTTASGDLASDVATLQGKVAKLEAAAIEAADGSVTVTEDAEANKTTVKVNVSAEAGNSLSLKTDGLFSVGAEYGIVKNENGTYQLTKDGEKVDGAIIEADQVVKSGTVETYAEAGVWGEAGTYIVLTIANKTSDKLYINVGGLIEYVTAGTPGANEAVRISVSADHKVTADLIDGKVLGKHLADGTVTLGKLATGVQTSLGKADSAVQSVAESTVNGSINVDGTDVAVKGLSDAAFETIANIQAGAVETAGTNADTKISNYNTTTVQPAIKAVDDKVVALQETTGKLGTLANKDEVTEDELGTALAAKINGKADKATTLAGYGITDAMTATAIESAISTAKSEAISDAEGKIATAKSEVIGTKLTDTKDSNTIEGAKRYADAVASGAQGGLVGNEDDTSDKNTIYGAKKYADEKASAAQTAAETTAANALKPVSDKADANETAIEKLNGDNATVGSVANKIKTAIDALDVDDAASTGKFVTAVKQTDGKIEVSRAALVASDIPDLTTAKITDFATEMAKKQDVLTFTDTPSATNKVATKTYVDNAVADLSGAMHFVGASTTDPTEEAGPTVAGVTSFKAGDVVTFENKEFVLDKAGTWRELGDESSYIVKGTKFKDADIAADAAIAQSKIATTGAITEAIAAAKAAADAAQTSANNNASEITTLKTTVGNHTTQIKALQDAGYLDEAGVKAVKVDAATKADQDGDGNVISTTYAKDASLAAIAKTGNVNDLIQTTGDVLVLDCN